MPKLSCSVHNCSNHAEGCCSLGKIDVSGAHADHSSETCCSNFQEQIGATNAMNTPNETLSVGCNATDCMHNSNQVCGAESISVAGAGATNSVDTQCSSFCARV